MGGFSTSKIDAYNDIFLSDLESLDRYPNIFYGKSAYFLYLDKLRQK